MEIRAHHTSFCLNHHAVKIWIIFWMMLLSKYPKKLVQLFDTCILQRYMTYRMSLFKCLLTACDCTDVQRTSYDVFSRAKKYSMLVK